ncbi:Rad17-domain-containing protein [Karstenula rhodostoma CBS 690.94]|uniref:Rad17-domain-containing protein n=1 Tax=Karstenula rhodostoma CBS 690.94 TaxID=1392251 RepID=A0A9P4PBM6_9PLEO|nr:Rad17-domain-containing protein [Karstenula rhodostoma CBS 690.94]
MVKPRAARKKPVVVSSGSDEDERYSPPAKRLRKGTLLSLANEPRASGDAKPHKTARRASSPKPSSTAVKKSPAKSKVISKPITSFFGAAPKPTFSQPTPSPEKTSVGTPVEFDDIFDSSDDEYGTARPTTLPVRKGKPLAVDTENALKGKPLVDTENALKGSRRFLRTASGDRATPTPSPAPVLETVDRRPWNEKYGPASLDELAVHKKKVADVRTWLTDVFSGKERKRLLLLKGPAGSGKTTTMALLSKELAFQMHEWKNPESTKSSEGGFISVTAQFEDFVGRTGTFGSLTFDEPIEARQQAQNPTEISREKQLILVEEFPNTFTRTSSAVQSFRSSVLNYLAATTPSATAFFSGKADAQSITPIVMVISETLLSTNTAAADSFTAHRLLGPEILTHPGVSVIEFNPIAATFMTKALDLIVVKEACKTGRKKTVGPQVIQRLTELGDIRSAVSSLEFLCLRGDETEGWGAKVNLTKKKVPKASKDIPMTRMEQESLEMVTQRESTLGIFHAVGRVVYNKRHPEDLNKPVIQPPNFFPERRRPKASEVDIETLIDELGTDTQTFVAALHENYVLSCDAGDSEETLDCINGSIDALSNADLLSPDRFGVSGSGRRNFQGTSADNLRQDEMSFQASVRGLLYNLPNPVKRIAPPPGVMGAKAKGAGASAAAARGSAFVMYYPSSLRLWRQQEEIGGLLELWISRAQRGDLFGAHGPLSKPAPAVTGGVDTWRKIAPLAAPAKPTASPSSQHKPEEDTPTPVLLGSGGSARYEMLLERLPYLPAILRKRSPSSPSAAATVREVRKITAFTGSGVAASPEDDDGDGNEDVGEGEQWATDKPAPDTPRRKKRVRIESKEKEESAIPGGEVEGGKLVLSEDDIED